MILSARSLGNNANGDEAALLVNKTTWPNTYWLDACGEWAVGEKALED